MGCGCNQGATATQQPPVAQSLSVASLYPGFLDVPEPAPVVQSLPGVSVVVRPAFPWWYVVLALGVAVVIGGGRK